MDVVPPSESTFEHFLDSLLPDRLFYDPETRNTGLGECRPPFHAMGIGLTFPIFPPPRSREAPEIPSKSLMKEDDLNFNGRGR